MISEQAQADGLDSNFIDLLSADLACFVCGGWSVLGPTPFLKLARAKECSLSHLEDIAVEALFQYLYGLQVEDDVEDLVYILTSVISLYLKNLRRYNWSSSTLQILHGRIISEY